jgi:hypothetical protein
MQDSCKALVWDQLMSQMDMSVKRIQQDIDAISRRGVQTALMKSAHLLGETIHLTPALSLFEDVFKQHGTLSSQPNLEVLLG